MATGRVTSRVDINAVKALIVNSAPKSACFGMVVPPLAQRRVIKTKRGSLQKGVCQNSSAEETNGSQH